MSDNSPELKDQFFYPKNSLLKKSLQGIISAVLEQRRIVFRPENLALAILNYHGWIDDSNLDSEKPPGQNYKKALNILKTFEGTFTKFRGIGTGLEVFIYRTNKIRVKSFDELEKLCSLDPDMSEIVATTMKLNQNQEWNDVYTHQDNQLNLLPTPEAVDRVLSTKTLVKDNLNEIISRKPNSFRRKHKGVIKGSDLSNDELDGLKASTLFTELIEGVPDETGGKSASAPREEEVI